MTWGCFLFLETPKSVEVLTLKKLGIDDLVHFDFLDPPAPETMMSLGFVRSGHPRIRDQQVCFSWRVRSHPSQENVYVLPNVHNKAHLMQYLGVFWWFSVVKESMALRRALEMLNFLNHLNDASWWKKKGLLVIPRNPKNHEKTSFLPNLEGSEVMPMDYPILVSIDGWVVMDE